MRFFVGTAAAAAAVIVIFISALLIFYPIKYKDEIRHAAEIYSVDKVLIASVINTESGFKKDSVSEKGAIGLMQILPSTAVYAAKMMNLDGYDLFNPGTNILIGTFYLKYLIDKFGDIKTALFAYNAGEGNVRQWLFENQETSLSSSPYKETNAYAEKVLNGKSFYRFRI